MITKSDAVLIIHTILFFTLISASVIVSILKLFFPFLIPKGALFIVVALFAVIFSSSLINDCPLTILENKLRNKEVPGSAYDEHCINHYGLQWFNLKLNPQIGNVIIIFFLLLPIVAELIKW